MPESAAAAITPDGADSCRIACHVQPRASKVGIRGMHGGSIKISLNTPPVDGKANAALCAYLAELLGVSKSAVALISGQTSREKVIHVAGVSAQRALAFLTIPD